MERVAASLGELDGGAITEFKEVKDVPNGGVLFALPALLTNGLLKHINDFFSLPKGFYNMVQIFLLLGFMALSRIKSIEQLRYKSPGEWGKILGLDRIPEVRTLRKKVTHITKTGKVEAWSGTLSKEWMEADPEAAGVLYIDGHVRVYHGKQTKLPRRFVSRQRLCLRGMTDYWVNDQQGQPFFVISTPFTSGLLAMLKNEIVPRLEKDIPNQPTQAELDQDENLHRFVLVFDREGYSPEFFEEMKDKRIACQTYRKFPKENWPTEEFKEQIVKMPYGEEVSMKLAEKRIFLAKKLWVREIRKLTDTEHQVSIISTDFKSDLPQISGHMFSRWSQENFFKYMMNHFNIDGLMDYDTEEVDETKKVINPAYRKKSSEIKSKAATLGRQKIKFSEIILEAEVDSEKMADYEGKKSEVREQIELLEHDLQKLKDERKKIPKHLPLKALPKEEQFKKLSSTRKQFIDTIKMIAYRAETALVILLRDIMRKDDIRVFLRTIFTTEVDIIPNQKDNLLTICLHNLSSPSLNKTAQKLCDLLNESESIYPGTNLRIFYKLVSI